LATVLGAAVVLAVALTALLAAQPADAAGRFKVVTKTFSSTQQITIPILSSPGGSAASPYPSEKKVGGFKKGKILDANLRLKNFSHDIPDDVDVLLYHRGVDRTVMSDAGEGSPVSGITLSLDDEAAGPLFADNPLVSGTFRPTNYDQGGADFFFPAPAPPPSGLAALSGFDGKNPNGPWRLYVFDDFDGGGGQIAGGWSITIKARVLR